MNTKNTWVYLVAILGFCSTAQAFTLIGTNSKIKGWNTHELAFHLNPENCPDGIDAVIEEALKTWNGVPTSGITVTLGDNTTATAAELKAIATTDVPAIVCSTNLAADANLDPNVIPGLAQGTRFDEGNHINYGYIVLNVQPGAAANINNLSEELVQVVIAHEVGHVLGLGHSENTNALMYYDASKKEQLSLSQDDMDGLVYLYARNEFGGDNLLGGCGMIAKPSRQSHWWLWFMLATPCLLGFATRRKEDVT